MWVPLSKSSTCVVTRYADAVPASSPPVSAQRLLDPGECLLSQYIRSSLQSDPLAKLGHLANHASATQAPLLAYDGFGDGLFQNAAFGKVLQQAP